MMCRISLPLRAFFFLELAARCSCLVRLATWNLLAPVYAKEEKYPWCDPQHLEWSHRQNLIVPQIMDLDADLVCLQEVQVECWPGLLSQLSPMYDGVLQNVTDGHEVSSALLVKKGCTLEIERVESRSRALIVVLRDRNSKLSDPRIYLGGVHLEAGGEEDNDLQRYHQLKSLFKRLSHHCRKDGTNLQDASIVLAGDFNMQRSNLMYRCLSEGLLTHPEQIKNKPPIKIVQLCDAFRCSPKQSQSETSEVLRKTFANGHVLDYIWTTSRIQVEKTLFLHADAGKRDRRPWPSHDHPSDHIPIGVELAL